VKNDVIERVICCDLKNVVKVINDAVFSGVELLSVVWWHSAFYMYQQLDK